MKIDVTWDEVLDLNFALGLIRKFRMRFHLPADGLADSASAVRTLERITEAARVAHLERQP